jgi:hypothetical protein
VTFLLLVKTRRGTYLPTDVAQLTTGHRAHHAVLKAAYDARGNAPLPDLTADSTQDEHIAIHQALHAEYINRGKGQLPTLLASATGHLSHHSALHQAHNASGG